MRPFSTYAMHSAENRMFTSRKAHSDVSYSSVPTSTYRSKSSQFDGGSMMAYPCHKHRRPWTSKASYGVVKDAYGFLPQSETTRTTSRRKRKGDAAPPVFHTMPRSAFSCSNLSPNKMGFHHYKPKNQLKKREKYSPAWITPLEKSKIKTTKKGPKERCQIFLGLEFPAEKIFKAPFANRKPSKSAMAAATVIGPRGDFEKPRPLRQDKFYSLDHVKRPSTVGTRFTRHQQQQQSNSLVSMSPVVNLGDRVEDYLSKLDQLHQQKLETNVEDPLFCRPQKKHFPVKMTSTFTYKSRPLISNEEDSVQRENILLSDQGMPLRKRRSFPKKHATVISLV